MNLGEASVYKDGQPFPVRARQRVLAPIETIELSWMTDGVCRHAYRRVGHRSGACPSGGGRDLHRLARTEYGD